MARHGTLRRNLRRNIRPWSDDDAARGRGDRSAAAKALAVFVALSLAGAFIPLVVNLVFRIPDFYGFDLDQTRAVSGMGEKVKADAIADAISSFMRHKTDEFQVYADAGEGAGADTDADANAGGGGSESDRTPLFTAGDGAVMETLRAFLDNILVIGLTSLVVFASLCAMLARWRRPRELKVGFIGGFVLYGAVICFTAIVIVFDPPVKRLWTDVIGARFTPEDVMPKLFGGGFFLTSWIAVTAITLVIMLILLSVMNRLTKSDMMFGGKQ
jgi:hypothetical protein